MHAQFIVVPPLAKIVDIFARATGCIFTVDVKWSRWSAVTVEQIEEFRKYIRPSHQQILNDVASGKAESPASLIRQLLRPHDYTIRRVGKLWTLATLKKDEGGAGAHLIKQNVVIDWNS
jgi:hypothetical protein